MQTGIYKGDKVVTCTNCITGKTEEVTCIEGILTNVTQHESKKINHLFIGPGLIDLQINGINGIDFNNPSLTPEDILAATQYLLSQGVTTFLPTVITNSDENILELLKTINQACLSDPLINDCAWGIHLEGPFISPVNGAKGAHEEKYIKAPDWDLFQKFQEAAGGRIRLVTLAPEWEGSDGFIKKCRENDVLVAIGHSMANSEQISMAVKAGATLSTHLGNGVPLLLARHPNIIWDQLSEEKLYACLITDGIHIPDAFIKVVIKTKGKSTLIVSDATYFAGMPPGEYQTHIGGSVVLDKEKRVSVKDAHGILAGAAKSLLEDVETVINHNLTTLSKAWQMASVNVAEMLTITNEGFKNNNEDKVIFQLDEKQIKILCVIKNGRIVFEQ